ncbi:site-specific integrase [Thioalkalivibrio sp. AKL10]|uniref:site-specific integrase n=1 Tax=Thioalkalivibrio sp. AKL10 TaxID=1158158 RepID=UPI00037B85DC|nr:site-specific integrase [Thioalkalivibrio sp. AKL10]
MTLHPVWIRPAPLAPEESIGREARVRQRALEASASLRRLQHIVRRESPELAHGSPPPEGQRTIEHIAQCIQEEAESAVDWRNQHNFFAVAIDRGNRQGLWTLTAPNLYLDLPRDLLLRDQENFRRGTQFVGTRKGFTAALDDLHRHEHRWQKKGATTLATRRGELVLASAVLFGGYCDARHLGFLPQALQSGPIQQCGEQLWLDIKIPESNARRLNLVGESEALHRWCIDDLTAALLANFLRHHTSDQFPVPPGENAKKRAKEVVSTIRGLMIDLGISTPSGMTPGRWCQGAWAALEREPGASVPAYLAEYALGRIPSCSLPPDRWVALLNQRVSPNAKLSPQPSKGLPDAASLPCPISPRGTPDKDTSRVARRLLKAFDAKHSKKLSRTDCVRRLEELISTQALGHHVVADLLAHWAIVLLSHGSSWYRKPLAPSTVYGSYLAPVARPLISLLASAEIDDLRDMDTDDFGEMYSDVLHQTRWKDKDLPAAALEEFHAYLCTQHGVAPLETTLSGTSRGTPRVRALIITEAEYQATRKAIQAQYKGHPTRKETLETALFLGFRAGLRPTECTKLRLNEILVSTSDTVITVRTNRYGTNKSRPSLRRIDLAALCPDDEFHSFSSRVAQLQAWFGKAPKTLLMSESPDRDIRIDRNLLQTQLQPILRQVTNNPHMVVYSLRHSALTRMHLRAEVPERDHEIHDPEGERPVDTTLVPQLTGGQPDSMKRLHAIGAIAGHASPEMTLTTYLHGMDLVLYEKVRQTLPRLEATVYAQLLGQSYESTKRFLKDQRQPDPASAANLRPRIVKALPTKKHTPPVAQPAGAHSSVSVPDDAPAPMDVNDLIRILKDHDNGYPLPLIAKRSGFEDPRCQAVIDAAQEVASIKSQKGQPRFVTKVRKLGFRGPGVPLTPAPLESDADSRLANRMIERMRGLLSQSGPLGDIGPVIEHFLTHVEAQNSGVRFYKPKEAKPFVELLRHLTDDHRMIFGTHVYSENSRLDIETQIKRWRDRLDIAVKSDRNRVLHRDGGSYGKLTVTLLLPTSNGRHTSAHAYKYVLHLAAIALLTGKRITPPS